MISIVVPVFNGEKYLQRLFSSFLKQTNNDFELILIDDCSTDNSGNICKHFTNINKNFRYIINEKNLGPEQSRLKGVKECRSDYVTFVDCDDYVSQNFVKCLTSAAKNIGIGLVVSSFTKVKSEQFDTISTEIMGAFIKNSESGYLETNRIKFMKKFFSDDNLLRYVCGKVYKKKNLLDAFTLISTLADFSHRVSEDVLLNYFYLQSVNNIVFISEPLYFYEQSNLSLTRNVQRRILDNINVWFFIYSNCAEKGNGKIISFAAKRFLKGTRYSLYKIWKNKTPLITKNDKKEIKIKLGEISFCERIKNFFYILQVRLLLRLTKYEDS